MKILHFSDIHLWRLGFDWSDPVLKRWLGVANLALRRGRRFPRSLARETVEAIAREEADAVIFSGDITTTALRSEFEDARELFVPILRKLQERFFILPGNHDRYTRRTLEREFFERAFPSGRFADPLRPIRKMPLGDSWAIVAFDCSVPQAWSSRGLFTETLERALDEELERQAAAGRKVILVGHYPYAAPPGITIRHEHDLDGRERLRDLVARRAPALYLHGHKHRRWAFRPIETPATLCINPGSASFKSRDPHAGAGFLAIELPDKPPPVPGAAADRTSIPPPSSAIRVQAMLASGEKFSLLDSVEM